LFPLVNNADIRYHIRAFAEIRM
jgi:hypothetical protein